MTVVVGYIPDKFGDAALAEGIEEARRRRTRLVVVNATRGDALIDRRYLGEEGLADLEERLAGVDVEHEVRQAMGADVAEEMIRVVREVDAQVLVIGMRHRTPVGKMIMGSVAQQVLLDAPCPVLAVKPSTAATPTLDPPLEVTPWTPPSSPSSSVSASSPRCSSSGSRCRRSWSAWSPTRSTRRSSRPPSVAT